MAYIQFQDSKVKQILLDHGVGSNGEITYEQAAAIGSISTWFKNNTTIEYFDELQYFTGLSTIVNQAFYGCSSLKSIILPNGISSIMMYAFYNCSSLTSITIPDSVTKIYAYAFSNCFGITNVSIGSGVTEIGPYALSSSPLSALTIPASVTLIGKNSNATGEGHAFADRGQYIWYCYATTPPTCIDSGHSGNPKDQIVYVPYGSVATYEETAPWSGYTIMSLQPITLPPTLSPSGGTVTKGSTVTITCEQTGVTMYYTTDGTNPTSASTQYTEPIVITGTTTIKVIAIATGYDPSSVVTGNFDIPRLPLPTFTPSGGTVSDGTIVTIEAASGASIYYTTDGTTPTTASTVYTNPLAITSGVTIKAIAVAAGYDDSNVASATFSIREKSNRAPRRQGELDSGIYVTDVNYSSTLRSGENVADLTWEYIIDGDPEDLGEDGTKLKVEDTTITIFVEFEYNGRTYEVQKVIPVRTEVGHIEQINNSLILDAATANVTLDNKLNINVSARMRSINDNIMGIMTDVSEYDLRGTSDSGTFLCQKSGGRFTWSGTLTSEYTENPSNEIVLHLLKGEEELETAVIPVVFESGAIFEVKEDAIRAAVAAASAITDEQVSAITNQISELNITVSGITGTVSANTTAISALTTNMSGLTSTVSSHTSQISQINQTVSGISSQVVTINESVTNISGTTSALTQTVSSHTTQISQIQQTSSAITSIVSAVTVQVSGLSDEVSGISETYATKSELQQTASSVTINVYNQLNEKTGIDVSAGTITFTANHGLYVKDSNNNTRIEISPNQIGAKEQHVWNSVPTTQIGMDGYYSGTQSAHTWAGTNEIELAVSGHVLDVNQLGVQRSSFLTESNNTTDTVTKGLYGDIGSTVPVRIITPTANNQSYNLSKNNGFVVVKNNSPQYDVQLVLPAAANSVGCRIFVKPLHDTYIKSSEDIYPAGDSVPYNQGANGINIGNDAYIYLCDGTAWYEFKNI